MTARSSAPLKFFVRFKDMSEHDYKLLADTIRLWGHELGFAQLAITDTDLGNYHDSYRQWLREDCHGDMTYMANNLDKRLYPQRLVEGTCRIISVRMDYAKVTENSLAPLSEPNTAYIARYARGRDYHKLMRKRLQTLADKIQSEVGKFGYRAFVDSAPVLERALAEKSGLGWIGKNTMLINKHAGSWFFLGELFTDLPLPVDKAETGHCGSCRACLDVCPTKAFIAPNKLDAKRCISYLTIELRSSIPVKFRRAIGNRIFGCDDCQLVCPWNKFAQLSNETDYSPRHALDRSTLLDLFEWSEQEFLERTEGSPIRRIGYECWLRNLAVGLGNAEYSSELVAALQARRGSASPLVREHIDWALMEHADSKAQTTPPKNVPGSISARSPSP